ncbi:hypothetical protein ACFV03_24245 [Streptomyces mirabilis]|uniref:hypothetical protein n=1 Tax=Streptomyces mirabilis TaxID=68239 RepID=UPI0036BDE9A5
MSERFWSGAGRRRDREPAAAEASRDPIRARILGALAEPGSAAMPTARRGLPRQKVNDHLKELGRMPSRPTGLPPLDGEPAWSDDERIQVRPAGGASRPTSEDVSGHPSARPAPWPATGPHRIPTAPHRPPSEGRPATSPHQEAAASNVVEAAASNRKPHTRNP